MSRDKEAFNLDIPDLQSFAVLQQLFAVIDRYLRQLVEMIDYLAAHLSGQIAVFDLTDVKLCLFEQLRAVSLHRADMIGILVCDKNMANGLRVDAETVHFLRKTVVIIACVDHDGCVALAVKENVRHPFTHAGDIFINPAGIQRLEYLFTAVHPAHFFFLKFGCLFGHFRSSFSFFPFELPMHVSGTP